MLEGVHQDLSEPTPDLFSAIEQSQMNKGDMGRL